MELYRKARMALYIAYGAKFWRRGAADALLRGVVARRTNELDGYVHADHLDAAAAWLARAQDASGDGGVVGRFSLREGWTSSYPETTGYIVPTMIRLADATGDATWMERGQRAIDFLLGVQLDSGAFPGLEIAENRTEASIFNTGQIIHGLTEWHRRTGSDAALDAAVRAGRWMAGEQESDGTWRKWTYGSKLYTYMAYAGGWLARLGEYTDDDAMNEAARRHLRWVLSQRDPETGWFRGCGFSGPPGQPEMAVTHTIAYTISGVLEMARSLGDDEGVDAARHAALRVARTLELRRRLPGMLDPRWRAAADFTCLTGNCQMALVWFDLHRMRHDPALVSAALKAIDDVEAAQNMESSNPAIRGAIAGSDPVWGEYIQLAYPNWAAKYFIDAQLARRDVLASLDAPATTAPLELDVPTSLPAPSGSAPAPQRLVLLAGAWDEKPIRVAEACRKAGVQPVAALVEPDRRGGAADRVRKAVREYGPRRLVGRALGRGRRRDDAPTTSPAEATSPVPAESFADYCARYGIERIEIDRLSSPESLAALERLKPDLAVHAGGGLVRAATLAIPRLGVINAHMGVLPPMRGMNVSEWSVMYGFPVGCTVHVIDEGVDTGDVLCVRTVPIDGCGSIAELREAVDEAQLDLLGDVVGWIGATGELPPRRPQAADEGRQYFALHPDVRRILERRLARD